MRPYLEKADFQRRPVVVIRGYGYCDYPTMCSYQTKAYEDEAIKVIEQYLDSLPTGGELRRDRYDFEIRTGDDGRHLFSYKNGRIHNDKRGVPVPEDARRRILIRIYDGKQNPPRFMHEFYDFEEQLSMAAELFLELEGRHRDISEIYFEVFSREGDKLLYRYRNGVVYDKVEE